MKTELSKDEVIGNELSFPVPTEYGNPRQSARELFNKFLLGYLLLAALVFGIRCTFFINAGFAEGTVTELSKTRRGYYVNPHITFYTYTNTKSTFAAAQNLNLHLGERVQVIYKKNNPNKAVVYSFFGFWFNAVLICQVLVLFWVGLLVAYYGDYP